MKQLLAWIAAMGFLLSFATHATAQPPAPTPDIIVNGQILDAEQGYLFFTTGDGFRMDPAVRIVDFLTKQPTHEAIRPRLYARVTFNGGTGVVTSVELSHAVLPPFGNLADVHKFSVALSTPAPNPDLVATTRNRAGAVIPREGLNGLPVLVTFTVQVPPTTPLTDSVYMSTDTSGWNPQAIRMDRIDALHYRIVRNLNSGTVIRYRYTRGTQLSAERGKNGLENDPRQLLVINADVQFRPDVVYHWGDESVSGQRIDPLAVPSPFQPNPFPGLPPGPRPTFTPPH